VRVCACVCVCVCVFPGAFPGFPSRHLRAPCIAECALAALAVLVVLECPRVLRVWVRRRSKDGVLLGPRHVRLGGRAGWTGSHAKRVQVRVCVRVRAKCACKCKCRCGRAPPGKLHHSAPDLPTHDPSKPKPGEVQVFASQEMVQHLLHPSLLPDI
jgi:hypothetical protein